MDLELHLSTCKKLLDHGEFALLEDIHLLKTSDLFDPDEYLATYPSIKDSGLDPYYHYCLYGWRDNLRPSSHFDSAEYIAANPGLDKELAKCQMAPLIHFLRYGRQEGRSLRIAPVCDNVALEIARLSDKKKHADDVGSQPAIKVADLLTREFRDLQPIPYFIGNSKHRPRLVLVTDALGTALLGGVGTALLLASQYAVATNRDLLIVTRHSTANTEGYFSFMKMMNEPLPETVSFYSDSTRDSHGQLDFRLEVFSDDEFFTTSWWSTRAVKNMHLPNRIFYIIQEVEQFFYPYCDNHLFCSQLRDEAGIYYLVNSQYLWDYFGVHYPHIVANGTFFNPAFPSFLYKNHVESVGRKHRLFFYSRRKHHRNLYYTGLKVLDRALREGIVDSSEWDIFFAGDSSLEPIEFSDGTRPTYLGQMSWLEYAKFMSSVDLTFSLMYTPHPSYPPLDTLASGGVCVTNSFENKNRSLWCENMIFAEMTDVALCEGLRKGVALSLDREMRQKNFLKSTLPTSWSSALESTVKYMRTCANA